MEKFILNVETSPITVVLDSNIWVDLLIFNDPHVLPIAHALEKGIIEAIVCPICRDEFARVIRYPQFAHKNIDPESALAWFDAHSTSIEIWRHRQSNALPPLVPLPRCTDRDDQKFLEVAAECRARWLISKDRAVLKTRKLMKSRTGVEVISLTNWLKQLSS